MHAITANKGPVVHGYRVLTDLARRHGRRFLFELAVMDGAPIFSLWREALPAARADFFPRHPEFDHQPDPDAHAGG